MIKTQTLQVNFTGGIVSPGTLKEVLDLAAAARADRIQFGLRQQLFVDLPQKNAAHFLHQCAEKNITCNLLKAATPNIISSYAAAGLFTSGTWLSEGVYKDIFSQIRYTPRLKINICDSTQNLVPFFTGHINWISSSTAHFWHLYIRVPKTQQVVGWPEMVYTNDIAAVSKSLEAALLLLPPTISHSADQCIAALFTEIKKRDSYIGKPATVALQLPPFSLPYYEGFNQSEKDLWLGIYRRSQEFPLSFLLDLCQLCIETKIGELYTTPWKSLIVKGIHKKDVTAWNWVLGKSRINVRHAANELAWQVEDGDENGLQIKRMIIRHFDKEDVRTYGLSFGVQSKPTASMFGSIIIRKQQNKNPHRLKSLERYDLLHTRDFNPNGSELILFREGLEKEQLGVYLVSLCKMYYQQQVHTFSLSPVPQSAITTPAPVIPDERVYQCPGCLSVYHPPSGDVAQYVAPGTPFSALPEQYACPLCETEKDAFKELALASLQLPV